MDLMKKLFPLSYKFSNDGKGLAIRILLYVAAVLLYPVATFIAGIALWIVKVSINTVVRIIATIITFALSLFALIPILGIIIVAPLIWLVGIITLVITGAIGLAIFAVNVVMFIGGFVIGIYALIGIVMSIIEFVNRDKVIETTAEPVEVVEEAEVTEE